MTPPKARPPKYPNDVLQTRFLAAYLAHHGHIGRACKEVGVHRNTVLDWRKKPTFRVKLTDAIKELEETLFAAAISRALEKSDVLMMFTLKTLNPERYDDNIRKAKWEAKRLAKAPGETPSSVTVNLYSGPVPPGVGPDPMDDGGGA